MANQYFALNSLAGCFRSSSAVVETTTAGRFDSAYASNAILVPTGSDFAQVKGTFLDGSTSLSALFYLRFDANCSAFNSSAMVFMLNGGANAYRLLTTSGIQVQYWNSGTSAWVNWGSAFSPPTGLNTFVLKLTPNVGFELYQAGTLRASSAVVPTNGAAAVDEFRFQCGNNSSNYYYSQIMCADYDIRDSHYMPELANGEGTYNTDGTGAYTDINEAVLNDSNAVSLTASGQHRSFTKASITVPVGQQITGMVVNARGRIGGTVTDGKILCKQGANDTVSAGKSYNTGYEPRWHFFATDPTSGSPFTQTNYNSAEFGIQAA
jgi:hypothetical protein